jgi:hypothetical protein
MYHVPTTATTHNTHANYNAHANLQLQRTNEMTEDKKIPPLEIARTMNKQLEN